jgi:hypothetical protein
LGNWLSCNQSLDFIQIEYFYLTGFIQKQAATLAQGVEKEPDDAAKLRSLYRRVLARDPDAQEMDLAMSYLPRGTLAQYAQVLLFTNEEIFWP